LLELLPDGSYRSVLVKKSAKGGRRAGLIEAARREEDLDPALARVCPGRGARVADRDGEDSLIALVTTSPAGRPPGIRPGRGLTFPVGTRDCERAGQTGGPPEAMIDHVRSVFELLPTRAGLNKGDPRWLDRLRRQRIDEVGHQRRRQNTI
jgi:hypothetical protein